MAKAKAKAVAVAPQQEAENSKKKKAAQKKQVSESEVRAPGGQGGQPPPPAAMQMWGRMHAPRRRGGIAASGPRIACAHMWPGWHCWGWAGMHGPTGMAVCDRSSPSPAPTGAPLFHPRAGEL